MHLIAYTSHANENPSNISETLKHISKTAKNNNANMGITGVLFYQNGRFLQIIEGEKKQLESLMKVIKEDKRHKNIERLIDTPMKNRGFGNWNMDSFNLSPNEDLDTKTLREISTAFKQTVQARSDLLTRFYKAMLQSQNKEKT